VALAREGSLGGEGGGESTAETARLLRWGFLSTHASVAIGLKTAEWRLNATVHSPYKLTSEHVKPALPALLVAQWYVQQIAALTAAAADAAAATVTTSEKAAEGAEAEASIDTLCAELTSFLEQCGVLKEPVVLGRPSTDGDERESPVRAAAAAVAAAEAAEAEPSAAAAAAAAATEPPPEYIKSSLLCWMVRKVNAALLGPVDVPMEVRSYRLARPGPLRARSLGLGGRSPSRILGAAMRAIHHRTAASSGPAD
jgi:hypothetical protein